MADASKRKKQRKDRAYDEGGGPLRLLIGPEMRLVIGSILIAACVFWLYRNDLLQKMVNLDPTSLTIPETANPLPVPYADMVFTSHAPGVGGLILMISTIFRKRRIAWLSWPAAALTVAGPTLLPMIKISLPIAMVASIAAGLTLAVYGILAKK